MKEADEQIVDPGGGGEGDAGAGDDGSADEVGAVSYAASNLAEDLTPLRLTELRSSFASDYACKMMQNAVTQTPVDDVALNREVVTRSAPTFSHRLDDWKVTDQERSGRCWCFAGLNLLRAGAREKLNLKDFEFSQNFTLFWDKLERANYFLEAIIQTVDEPVDSRRVAWLLDRPLDDGGQWNMFVNIVLKHGLVPKSAMPETKSSADTRRMNEHLIAVLREGARELRGYWPSRGRVVPPEVILALRECKHRVIGVVHRILCIHLGSPPERFDWQWNDKDKQFHRDGELTPLDFARRYVTVPLEDYVCLVHDPRPDHPPGRTYTVRFLGNVVGGRPVVYLNVDIDLMREVAARALVGGEPVWMGCDVAKMMNRDLGLWDADLFDYDGVYDNRFEFDKAARLEYHESLMTHAMLFTGVDLVGGGGKGQGRPRRWRVENSWGEKSGKDGFYTMNDNWFGEYVFEIAARRSLLPEELRAALEEEPEILPPWDPMGALARADALAGLAGRT